MPVEIVGATAATTPDTTPIRVLFCFASCVPIRVFDRVAGKIGTALLFVGVSAVTTFLSCILCIKRKEDDVFPTAYVRTRAAVYRDKHFEVFDRLGFNDVPTVAEGAKDPYDM